MSFERWFYIVRLRLRTLFRRGQVEAELDEEFEYYVERKTEELVGKGLTPPEARYAALRAMGGLEQHKEECRAMRGVSLIEDLVQDLRYGFRMLRRSPGFAAVAVLSLALGIGANTAIFSVIDALMLRALPVPEPEQLVGFRVPARGNTSTNFAYPQYQRIKDRLPVFSGVAAAGQPVDRYNITLNGPGGGLDPRQVWVAAVSGNYFSLFGVNAAIGRTLTPDDDRVPGGHPVTVISYGYWKSRFALSPEVLGRTLTLNGTSFTILGVTPRGFSGELIGRSTDLWFPAAMERQVIPEAADFLTNPTQRWIRIVARLKPEITIDQARAAADTAWRQAEMDSQQLTAAGVQNLAKQRLELDSLARGGFSPFRETFAQPLTILMVIVALVLLIACVNVANLLLARASVREREIAMRRALGAGRARVVRQLLAEGLLLAVPAGVLGIFAGVWVGALAPRAMDAGPLLGSLHLEVSLDWRMVLFSSGLGLVTLLLFGLAPALGASRTALTPGLKGPGNAGRPPMGRFRLSKTLVITQVALSLVLLAGAGLLVRTLSNLQARELGFDRERVLLFWTRHGQTVLGRGPALVSLYRNARDRISALPGVRSVGYSGHGLFGATSVGSPITVEGHTGEAQSALWDYVEPRFLETIGIPVIAGRGFTDQDDTPAAPLVAIINETMARYYFGDTSPIGRRFSFPGKAPWEIVGVMKDSNLSSIRDRQRMEFYIPHREGANLSGIVWLGVRTAGEPTGLREQIRSELLNLDPNLAVLRIDTLSEEFERALGQDRIVASLCGLFGVLAALLTYLGLYGVMSYTAARRTNEIGIRMALGATRTGVVGMVLRECLWLALGGIALGIPATLGAARFISARLFGVSPADPLTLAGATLLMVVVAVVAAFVPARRAARVDPMVALRSE